MSKLLPDGPIDTLGIFDGIVAMPATITEALTAGPVRGLVPATEVDHIVVVTPGQAQTAGEALAVLVAPTATVPILVVASGALPAYVGARSLVMVASLDDDAHALAAVEAARSARAAIVVVAPVDSVLAAAAEGASAPVVAVTADVPVARLGVAAVVVHLLAVLEQLGHTAAVAEAATAAVTDLERRRTELTGATSPAARLARRIGRTLPIFYATDALTGVAAAHWKRHANLHAKVAALSAALPALAWEDVSGWGQHGDMTRQVFSLVTLTHDVDRESAATTAALATAVEMLDEVVHDHHTVAAEGASPLGELLDLIFYGDLVSWHLAQELEIDPGPTAAVDAIAAV